MQFKSIPRFKLVYIFWLVSLIAAALARFGTLGVGVAVAVLLFWLLAWTHVTGRFKYFQELIVFVIGTWVVVTLLLPAVYTPRNVAKSSQCRNNLLQIQLALLNYESANGSFPPTYIADEFGKPMHSWRVLILPFMEEEALYDRYNFDEPWDSPANSKLLAEIPSAYLCPSYDDGLCRYSAVTGKDSAWRAGDPVRIEELKGGTANCVMVSETLKGVPWTKPEDTTPEEFLETAIKLGQSAKDCGHRIGGESSSTIAGRRLNQAYADGRISTINVPQEAHWLAELSRRSVKADRNSLEPRHFEPKGFRKSSVSGWVLLALCLMPVIPLTQLKRRIAANKSKTTS